MSEKPFDLSEFVTSAELSPLSPGFRPAQGTVSGYLDDGAAETIAGLWPLEPGRVTVVQRRRWWQAWKRRRPPVSVLARVTGVTEVEGSEGTYLTVTFEEVKP